jgi:Xaa-Pro aminopeptidase
MYMSAISNSQRRWLNDYHQRCIDETGAYLLDYGHQEAYDWLLEKSQPIET